MKRNKPPRLFATAIGILLLQISIFSQPDLVVSQAEYSPSSIKKEDIFSIEVVIKNQGNTTASQSYMLFYFSTDTNFSDNEIISRVSVKSLAPGATTTVRIVYPIPRPLISGTYYLGFEVDAFGYVVETNEDNIFYHPNKFTIQSSALPKLKIPYPIVFIHGLNGDSDTWNPFTNELDLFYGLSYGGRMDFCLNSDNNTSNANFSNDYTDFSNFSNLVNGDYYYVNFAVNSNGVTYLGNSSNPSRSNQSAIFKQGRAVKDAIKHVLNKTGSEKVILVGHSMGGLAAREYLQNASNYQSDGKHHVAKLLTIGTPHGGSNSTFLGVGLSGVDELSEAVRDLRTSYYTGYAGCYLFGGLETLTQMNGAVFPFVNIDVNCNGTIGQSITGLNDKSFPTDITYSSIIGYGSLLGGDAVVSESSANINNQISVDADTFRYSEFVSLPEVLHTILHKRTPLAMKGIDEPNEYALAYDIEFNKLYFGFSTIQPVNGYDVDYDDFRVDISQSGKLKVSAFNLPVESFLINIVNEDEQILTSAESNGSSNLEKEIQLQPGIYYVEFETEWTTLSYRFPYAFKVEFTPIVSSKEALSAEFYSKISPNPASNEATLTYNLNEAEEIEIIISDVMGRVIVRLTIDDKKVGKNSIKIDLSTVPSGMYFYSINNKTSIETKPFVVTK